MKKKPGIFLTKKIIFGLKNNYFKGENSEKKVKKSEWKVGKKSDFFEEKTKSENKYQVIN